MKKCFFVLLFLLVISSTSSVIPCEESYSFLESPRLYKSSKPGEYYIQSLTSITLGEPCTNISTGGLLRLYAVKFAIDTRTKFRSWTATLGYRIDDTCLNLPITMTRGIELVNQQQNNTCLKVNADSCQVVNNSYKQNKLLAVIGAYYSFTTVPLSSLLGVYSIPQLSFGASTPLLSKRADFPSSFRTIPSDEFAVEAMIDIIKYFNWTYIFAVGSDDDYGKLGLNLFKKRANDVGICITGDMYIPFETEDTKPIAVEIVNKIQVEDKATVVVMFNYALGMGEHILKTADELNLKRIWLTSEAWNPEVLSSTIIPESQLSSIITISLDLGPPLPAFLDYVRQAVYNDSDCNIWLHEYVKQRYNCSIQSSCNRTSFRRSDNLRNCSINASEISNSILEENPSQINNLIDLVDSAIHAIDKVAMSQCAIKGPCSDISPDNVTKALQNISFTTRFGKKFSYNADGNPSVVSYSIEQIQYDQHTNKSNYVSIGRWSRGDSIKSEINISMFASLYWSPDHVPKSICSVDCQPGEKQVGLQGCCWTCEHCPENTITKSINQDKCIPCPVGYHTVSNTICEMTPIIYLGIEHPIGIVTVTLSVLGIILNIICMVLVFVYKDTDTIKNSSREYFFSSFVLLFLTFSYTFFHIASPTNVSCRAQGVFYHTVSILYSVALLLKHKSLARFVSKFINNKKNEVTSQILIFVCVVAVEIGFIIAWQVEDKVFVERNLDDFKYFEKCQFSFTIFHVLSYAYPLLVVVITLIQTLSDRDMFSQDRDLKYLHYTCLAFCIIGVADGITVNHVVGVYTAMVTLCASIAYGYVYMGCMVLTKLFHAIILTSPKNITANGNSNEGFQSKNLNTNVTKDSVDLAKIEAVKKTEQ